MRQGWSMEESAASTLGGSGRVILRVFLPWLLVGLGGPSFARAGSGDDGPWRTSPWRSFPSLEWERHQDLAPWDGPPVAMVREAVRRPPVEVLGFLPYWTLGTALVPMDRITTLVYFAVGVNGDGSLGSRRDWGSPVLTSLVAEARTAGVRPVLAVTCFDGSAMASLLSSATNRRRAIQGIVDLVIEGGGEGVNVDFEGLPVAQKATFVTFVRDLKAAMDDALGRPAQVTVDTPAVDWSGAYDYDQLALAGDGLVIMGYDYHYRGGDPGPVAPLRPSEFWGKYSLEWTLDDYDRYGGVENRQRFLLALPLYGYDWPSSSTQRGAQRTGNGTARFYADCQRRAQAAGGYLWDEDSTTPWYVTTTDGIRQTWCEDRRSLTAKVGLVARRGLGGLAFWALGYEESLPDPWIAIEEAWPMPPDLEDEPFPERGDPVPEAGGETPELAGEDVSREGEPDSIHWPEGFHPWRDVVGAGDVTPQDSPGSGHRDATEDGTGAIDRPLGGGDRVEPRESSPPTGSGGTVCRCDGCHGGRGTGRAGPGFWAWLILVWLLGRAFPRRTEGLPAVPGHADRPRRRSWN